jgi:hypothetical protein
MARSVASADPSPTLGQRLASAAIAECAAAEDTTVGYATAEHATAEHATAECCGESRASAAVSNQAVSNQAVSNQLGATAPDRTLGAWPRAGAGSRGGASARAQAAFWPACAALAAALLLVVWSALAPRPDAQPAAPPPSLTAAKSPHGGDASSGLGSRSSPGPAPTPVAAPLPGNATQAAGNAYASRVMPRGSRPSNVGHLLLSGYEPPRPVRVLASQTGWQLAAAVRALPGMGGASQAALNAIDAAAAPSDDAGSEKSWTESMSDAWERWFDTLPAQRQTTRS